tara:strand:+ start:1257 stop:1874 length:618 start_codon:yes stop_codon:yes gene_type:complete
MKNSLIIGIHLGLLLLAFGCQDTKENNEFTIAEDPKEVREIINTKNKQIESWLKEGLVDSVATIFAKDVVQMPPNQKPVEGIGAFKKMWKENVSQGIWDFKIQTIDLKLSGDIAVERGSFKLSFSPNETAQMPAFKDEGNYVVLWERIDGVWKIVWDAPVSTMAMESMTNDAMKMKEKIVLVNKNGSKLKRTTTTIPRENPVSLK